MFGQKLCALQYCIACRCPTMPNRPICTNWAGLLSIWPTSFLLLWRGVSLTVLQLRSALGTAVFLTESPHQKSAGDWATVCHGAAAMNHQLWGHKGFGNQKHYCCASVCVYCTHYCLREEEITFGNNNVNVHSHGHLPDRINTDD